MPLSDVTAAYVDLITNSQYAVRTANSTEFAEIRDLVSIYMSERAWPTSKFKHGIALLMAHFYAQTGNTSGTSQIPDVGGSVASESVGDLSRSYKTESGGGSSAMSTEWLSSSRYGREWLTLFQSFKSSPSVTGSVKVSISTQPKAVY